MRSHFSLPFASVPSSLPYFVSQNTDYRVSLPYGFGSVANRSKHSQERKSEQESQIFRSPLEREGSDRSLELAELAARLAKKEKGKDLL